MQKKSYTALFAVVMMLMLIPFVPAYIEQNFNAETKATDFIGIPTSYASSGKTQISDYLTAGYIGSYGPMPVPAQENFNPKVLGIFTQAANSGPNYQAQEIDRSNSTINLNPGQAVTFWIDFLNTGASTWHNSGNNFVAVNLTGPAGRHSPFQHPFWSQYYYRPGRLLQSEVKPGQTGRFRFALQAPQETGLYLEKFNLVSENLTWIEGGYFEINIGVGEKVNKIPDYQAQEIERSNGGVISVKPGQAFTFWVDFKNTGLKNWYNNNGHFVALNVTDPIGRVSDFKHDFWSEYYYRPTRLLQTRIYPGEGGRFRFALQAPNVEGYYTEKFALVAENLMWIPGGEFTMQFKVGNPPEQTADNLITDEPNVRIGLYETADPVTITADGKYKVIEMTTGDESLKSASQTTTINYSDDTYVRLVPQSVNTIMEITSFDNAPVWNKSLNDNKFRGTIEIRYSAETKEMWVINELPIESYLKGLAEVSNEQPEEYLKALITAARSYALWHEIRGGKHPDNFYDINATTDQVYRGYGFESRSIDPIQAVVATQGIVITHPDAISQVNPLGIAVAAYSSGTDGRTRSWTEVWKGSGFPWLVSVVDPYGKISNWNTLSGNHMVGLSAQGARGYATEEEKTYDWILKHYYTGTKVEKIY
ncbi:MAG: SpoIID/LytB domain-containing protein [Patescibacteria group bacterium]|jgi:peptidoglycan hydrolase-like amidase